MTYEEFVELLKKPGHWIRFSYRKDTLVHKIEVLDDQNQMVANVQPYIRGRWGFYSALTLPYTQYPVGDLHIDWKGKRSTKVKARNIFKLVKQRNPFKYDYYVYAFELA